MAPNDTTLVASSQSSTDTELDRVPQTGEPVCAHIVKTEPGESARGQGHRGPRLRHPPRGAVRSRVGSVT